MGWRRSVARRKPSNKAAAWFQLVMRCQRSRMTTPSRSAETELSVRAISSASASRWAFSLRNKRYKLSNKSPQAQGKRSEEHTSELQSRGHLVCRLLLEKKKEDHKN